MNALSNKANRNLREGLIENRVVGPTEGGQGDNHRVFE
jgi:hypothetical protein